ncbi:MAG: DMT family transporter [Anaerolineae bacterium]|nr:DMT family transporter [Anaerolineae bacterium]
MNESRVPMGGVMAAFLTPVFLGMAPIFGKIAINAGADSFSVAAIRTAIAVGLLWVVYLIFFRRFIYIYPAGLFGCVVIGVVNGIGSLFYYAGLGMLDASLTQLLNGMYLVFAVLLVRLSGERLDRRSIVRVALALLALIILTGFGYKPVNWLGVGLMLGNALMFAGTMILSRYVLWEMPSPTVTLYVLTTMGVIVIMVWLVTSAQNVGHILEVAATPIFILGVTTAISRLAMFSGVKLLGSLQTAILAIAEIGVALALAFVLLGDRLTAGQWVGVGLLMGNLLLVRGSDLASTVFNPGTLLMANLSNQQFQWIAFHRAFAKEDVDAEQDVMGTLTTMEMEAIRAMMGADSGPMDPYPINPTAHYTVDLSLFLHNQDDETVDDQAAD